MSVDFLINSNILKLLKALEINAFKNALSAQNANLLIIVTRTDQNLSAI